MTLDGQEWRDGRTPSTVSWSYLACMYSERFGRRIFGRPWFEVGRKSSNRGWMGLLRVRSLRSVEGDRWAGLHELLSRVVAERLHELPPPTQTETLGMLLSLVADGDRRTLVIAAGLEECDLAVLADAAGAVVRRGSLDAAA